MIKWTDQDREFARYEGWFISVFSFDFQHRIRSLFSNPNEVLSFVLEKASQGSEFHIRALSYVAYHKLMHTSGLYRHPIFVQY